MTGELHRGEGLERIANAAQGQGTYSFNEDDLRSMIKKWRALADSYRESTWAADSMRLIKPPGDDFASAAHARVANASGVSYAEYVRHNWQYCKDQADLFEQALNDYLGIEDTNAAEIEKNNREV